MLKDFIRILSKCFIQTLSVGYIISRFSRSYLFDIGDLVVRKASLSNCLVFYTKRGSGENSLGEEESIFFTCNCKMKKMLG